MSSSTLFVLYVDDEPDFLLLAEIYLKEHNIHVDSVRSAKEAISTRNFHEYDAIVSDYMMTGMNGIDFLKHIRSIDSHVPFILFTGRGREEIVVQAIENGADYYVQKYGDFVTQYTDLIHKIQYAVSRRESEKAKVENEEAFYIAFEQAPDAIFWFDACTGEIIRCNTSAEELMGIGRSKILGKKADLFSPPDESIISLSSRISDLKKPGLNQSDSFETILVPYHGSPVPVTVSMALTKIGNKEIIQCFFRDISEKIQSEIKTKKTEDMFRLLADNVAAVIFRMNFPSGTCDYVSSSATDIFGYSPNEFYDRPFLIGDIIHENWKDQLIRDWENIQFGCIPEKVEYQIIRKDGQIRWMTQQNHPVFDDKRNIYAIEGVISDITALKKAEEKIRISEKKYHSLFENLAVPTWVLDFSDIIIWINSLSDAGIRDLETYLNTHNQELKKYLLDIQLLDVNQKSIIFFETSETDLLLFRAVQGLCEESWPVITKLILSLYNGQRSIEDIVWARLKSGLKKLFLLRISVDPSDEIMISRVYLSFLDITRYV